MNFMHFHVFILPGECMIFGDIVPEEVCLLGAGKVIKLFLFHHRVPDLTIHKFMSCCTNTHKDFVMWDWADLTDAETVHVRSGEDGIEVLNCLVEIRERDNRAVAERDQVNRNRIERVRKRL